MWIVGAPPPRTYFIMRRPESKIPRGASFVWKRENQSVAEVPTSPAIKCLAMKSVFYSIPIMDPSTPLIRKFHMKLLFKAMMPKMYISYETPVTTSTPLFPGTVETL